MWMNPAVVMLHCLMFCTVFVIYFATHTLIIAATECKLIKSFFVLLFFLKTTFLGDNNDHAKLIVGIVVGLLLAALVAGLAYWLYIKKSG